MTRGYRQIGTHRARSSDTILFPSVVLVVAAVVAMFFIRPVSADENATRSSGTLSDKQIAALVEALGDPSYETRVDATRRLCAIGPRATAALKRAAEGDVPETALRAGKLLDAFERLLFAGVEITLRFSKGRISWDESVDLIVTMANRAPHVSLIPVPLPFGGSDTPGHDHARQVAGMIDLADWLVVRTSDGKKVSLHVDDIDTEAAIADVIRQRLDDGPISSLAAGESVTLTLEAFNKGWARFRMLDTGRYTVGLVYEPQWQDEQLLTQRVGAVESNVAAVEVKTAAPATISRGGRELSLEVSVRHKHATATLTNHLDRAVHINTHFGTGVPFAKGRWIAESGERRQEISILPELPSSWQEFDSALIVKVPAGKSIVLAKAKWTQLRERFTKAGADLATGNWTLQFSYGNLLDRKWQRRHPADQSGSDQLPPGLRDPLPLWMSVTRVTSGAVAISASD
ncbi:MAG: hypothetical protein IH987_20025 [Planctomycetes bacterium]|nr:hypothetical protein [Planctomycetota bacterium]